MASVQTRLLYGTMHDGGSYTDQETLTRSLLSKPDKINPVITHLSGREDKRFPLSFLTEGQKGGVKPVELNDIEYEWDVFNRLKTTDIIESSTYGASDKPGLNFTYFYVVFKSDWLRDQHMIESPNNTQALIVEKKKVGNGTQYTLQLANGTADSFCDPSELAAGTTWGMVGGAPVAQSLSVGNESNVSTPGKMKNQISILRKSYTLAGNISNKTVTVEFKIDNKTTRRWIDFERWQHMLNWKQTCEEHYWYSRYNRLADGTIPQKDAKTGKPIPIGAGVLDQIPNNDTYSRLTVRKFKNTVTDVMYGATDTGAMNVVLFTGEGGAEEFDRAIKEDGSGFEMVKNSNVGDKFVSGNNPYDLTYGAYFTTYRHVDGHTITVKKVPLFDHGGRAQKSPAHPETGKPLESYRMVFLDMSTYDGVRNVQMATEKGRSMKTGILKGMADTPYDFGGNNQMNIATDQDISSVHFLSSKGICINRSTHCFNLECSVDSF